MAVLLDIEGTVCPISFVRDTLFPYFLKAFPLYLDKPRDGDLSVLNHFPAENLRLHIETLVRNDVKDPRLKAFQGIVWEKGYENGEIVAPVYSDAIEFIQRHNVYIYSSGSVAAQKLLFRHVEIEGQPHDLTPHIKGYFDITTAGTKRDPESYVKISRETGIDANAFTFYSDNVDEVRAARAAGMQSLIVVRPGNAPVAEAVLRELGALTHFGAA